MTSLGGIRSPRAGVVHVIALSYLRANGTILAGVLATKLRNATSTIRWTHRRSRDGGRRAMRSLKYLWVLPGVVFFLLASTVFVEAGRDRETSDHITNV